jgi:Zn-dependent metalloprotease
VGGKRWQDGEDLSSLNVTEFKALRSLQSPGTLDGDFQVANWEHHFEGDDVTSDDVHQNSGILNKAFWEAAQTLGVEPAAEIWLRGLQEALPCDYKALGDHPLTILGLAGKISSVAGSEKQKINDAFNAVGVHFPKEK